MEIDGRVREVGVAEQYLNRAQVRAPAEQATLLVSLHQPELAREHCTRAVGLREGRLVFDVAIAEWNIAMMIN